MFQTEIKNIYKQKSYEFFNKMLQIFTISLKIDGIQGQMDVIVKWVQMG